MSEAAPKLPPDAVARVESAELQTLIKKVNAGGVLTKAERATFTALSEKYGPGGKLAQHGEDPVPVSQAEGGVSPQATRKAKEARVQVVLEWLAMGFGYRDMVAFAAKRWGIAPRTFDDYSAAAKRTMADPRLLNLAVARDVQLRRITKTYNLRMLGLQEGDPLDALKEISKLLGLNAPERFETHSEISTPSGEPLVQFVIPDNGRSKTQTEDLASDAGQGA